MLRMGFESLSGGPMKSVGEFNPILFSRWTLFGHRFGWISGRLYKITSEVFPFLNKKFGCQSPSLKGRKNTVPIAPAIQLFAS